MAFAPAWLVDEHLAIQFGLLSTLLFSVVYLPQLWLNYRRKNTDGFSESSMSIKLMGASFLSVPHTSVVSDFCCVRLGSGPYCTYLTWLMCAVMHKPHTIFIRLIPL